MGELEIAKMEQIRIDMENTGHHFCNRACKFYDCRNGCMAKDSVYADRMKIGNLLFGKGVQIDNIEIEITKAIACDKWELLEKYR